MMSRRSDNVFFLVLVDFFLQVIVLGLVLYAAVVSSDRTEVGGSPSHRLQQLDALERRVGISNIDSLTDVLTRLVPIDSAGGGGGLGRLDMLTSLVQAHGGLEGLDTSLRRLEVFELRVGIHPCVDTVVDGKHVPISLGAGILTDSSFRLTRLDARLRAVFDSAGVRWREGGDVPMREWEGRFGRVRRFRRGCSYRMDVEERTAFRAPVERLWKYFQLQSVTSVASGPDHGH